MSFAPDAVTFDHIGNLVMQELRRRLASPEDAADLPGTLLMKVASDYVKHLEKRNEIEQAKLDKENEDPLAVVVQEGLPFEMRFEILNEFIDMVEDAWRRASTVMEAMLKEVADSDTGVLPEGQDVVPEGDGVPDVREDAEVQQGPADGPAE